MSEPAAETPAPRRRGRPPSGVPRKEQIRRAVEKHRRKAKFGDGGLLQVELPVYLLMELRAIATREGKSLREVVTGFLAEGWKADYLARCPEGSNPEVNRQAAEAMIGQWERDFDRSFGRE